VKISALVQTYNEANRIDGFMRHATKWADEVVVVDKTSPDGTAKIAADMGARVNLIPYSPNGHGNYRGLCDCCSNDWIWFFTAGEIPTRSLVSMVKRTLDSEGDSLDLILIPKKLYSFGIHDTRSPWSISYQPFVLNRLRAKIQDTIHANFHGTNAKQIDYAPDCFVLHPTHPNVAAFLKSHFDYIEREGAGITDPMRKIQEAAAMLSYFDFGNAQPTDPLFGQMCAWRLYWYGVLLEAWEKMRGHTSDAHYAQLRNEMLEAEWK